MREHIRILGILNMVMGCLTALGGVIVLIVMGAMSQVITASLAASNPDYATAAPFIVAIGMGVAVFLLILAAPAILGGWGLLNFRPWSRTLMIILSILHLIHVPLGTALGVYGLWVLLSDESRRLLETGGQHFPSIPGPYTPSMAAPTVVHPTQPPPTV